MCSYFNCKIYLRATSSVFKNRLLVPSTFNGGVTLEMFSTQRNIFYDGYRRKNGDRCLRILIVSTNIIIVLSGLAPPREREREKDGRGFDNRQMAERMAEINVEKVSSIKTVMSFNHRSEIILKARVNILPPVAHQIRSPRDQDFERYLILAFIVPSSYP